jgi:micrococcal nuclease
MRFARGVMLAATLAVVPQTPRVAGACGVTALVTQVFDGDTLETAGVGRVRLLGIDAPELGGRFERPAPFAIEARERLQALVLRRWVRLECDDTRRDTYGRHLAYVFVGGRDLINVQLVREGLARVSARTRLQHWDALSNAEQDAQARRRGMWGDWPRVPASSYTLPRTPRN